MIFFATFLSSISLVSYLIYEESTPHIQPTMISFFKKRLPLIYSKFTNIFTNFVFACVATPAVEKRFWIFFALFNFTTLYFTLRLSSPTGFQFTIWVFWYYVYYCPININWDIFYIIHRYIFKRLCIFKYHFGPLISDLSCV